MAKSPNQPSGTGSTAEQKAKAKRTVGPRTLFLVFKPGTSPDVVTATKAAIEEVTMNGRALLRHLQGGEPSPFLSFTVSVEQRGDPAAEAVADAQAANASPTA